MPHTSCVIGRAVFIRTDTPDYAEETIAFKSLEEMVRICSSVHENLTLDRVIIYSLVEGERRALSLGFIATTKGRGPHDLEFKDEYR